MLKTIMKSLHTARTVVHRGGRRHNIVRYNKGRNVLLANRTSWLLFVSLVIIQSYNTLYK